MRPPGESLLRALPLAALLAGCASKEHASAPQEPDGATLDASSADSSAPDSTDASAGDADVDANDAADASDATEAAAAMAALQARKQAIVDLRFGMFLHFGILTYTGMWAQPNLDITQFNPTALDPGQWAAAAKAAGMTFGVLTTRHHDGFALWPSAASDFNVGHIPWQNGQGDVVRQYVDAFRAAGLQAALYYSIWDTTEGIGEGPVTAAQMAYVTTQLTELLTNYGPIPLLVFDGWAWKMGHHAAPFQQIHDLVKSLQPDILIVDHNGLESPLDEDLVMFEEPKGAFAPPGNVWAALQGNKINGSGGNDWFWAPDIGDLMPLTTIVQNHLGALRPRHTTFVLNCPPNRDGVLDPAIVSLLGQVGATWNPGANVPLPDQGVENNHPYTAARATATSGSAALAIDGLDDYGAHTVWQSSGAFPQSITLDLGAVNPDVGFVGYLPAYPSDIFGPAMGGLVTSYSIAVSSDGSTFTPVTTGTWPGDGQLQHATFGPVAARYVRLSALATNDGTPAGATEVTVGGAP
jgi:alpha-L-fucosidase